ncbi:MAG: bifunctional uridylyltransferase/uridylyl-removing protein GlnD, partial [Kangiellaceae bacterium]
QEDGFVTSSEVRVIDKDFQIIDNKIDVINTDCFSKNSSQLLYIFHVLANHPETDGITAKTLRAIRASRNKINKKFINNKVNQKLFLSFWSIKHQTARAMFLMKRNGILSDYLPSFKKISGQMQYDMFHSYTVDEHTLFLLRNLAEFTHENNKIKFPLCHEIMNRQEQPELIYLAGLFHDIGKGLGGDHSELGKAIALEFCEQHKMPVKDTEIITWLVENHLMMSLFSQKRDTSDPKVIESFAKLVDNQLKLELLYILTVADIRATNKTLWNSWKDSLLRELYLNTSAYLKNNNKESNEEISPNNKSNKSLWHINQIATKNELINNGYELEDIDALWELLGDRYFIKRSAEAVIWHTRIILDAPIDESIVVGIRKSGERNSNEVFIYTKDQADLFATLAASLNQQGLNIYGANIHTDKNGYCYDSFFVLNEQDKIITDTEVKEQIIQTIKKNVSEIKTKELNVSRRMPRQIKYFTVDTKIEFSADEFSHLTRIDITAKNQPGFLAAVGRVFVKNKIKLHDAKITTFGEKVEDTFLISDKNNQPIIDKGAQQNIRESIIEFLD